MNNALAINEGAEDALLQAMVKPLFIKRRQTQRAQGLWESTIGEGGMRTHILRGKLFFFSPLSPPNHLVWFLLFCHISNN